MNTEPVGIFNLERTREMSHEIIKQQRSYEMSTRTKNTVVIGGGLGVLLASGWGSVALYQLFSGGVCGMAITTTLVVALVVAIRIWMELD